MKNTDIGRRRDGWVYFSLALVGTVGAVWVACRFDLPVASTVTAFLPSLAGMYLAWATFRNASHGPTGGPAELGLLADRLAAAAGEQWNAEISLRGVNNPYPLPVAWGAADPALSEPWELLCQIALGWPGGPLSDVAGWAGSPAELAGQDGEIAEVFVRRVPTRRLVVLGSPGSGKTVLLIRFLLGLMRERAVGGPVPVLLPLASWDPTAQPLDSWMAQRLTRDYPFLGRPLDAHDGASESAVALVRAGLVLPLLDGFDELPATARALALDLINETLALGQAVVLSSRADAYRETAAPRTALPARLAAAAAVELRPLNVSAASGYLLRHAGGPGGGTAARWQSVAADLAAPSPTMLQDLLTNPLMLTLAAGVYNPRRGEHPAELPDPAQLCDRILLPDRRAAERHLLGAYVPAAYRPHPLHPCRWSPQQAAHTLRFLASHLQHRLRGSADLAWWQLQSALPRRLCSLLTGIVIGLSAWAAAFLAAFVASSLTPGANLWWVLGAEPAIVGGLSAGLASGIAAGVTAGLTSTLLDGVAFWLVDPASAEPRFPSDYVPIGGIALGFASGLIGSLIATSSARRDTTNAAARRPSWSWHWKTCLTGLAAGLSLWFPFAWLGATTALATACVNALVYALAGGLLGSTTHRTSENPAPASALRWSFDGRALALGLLAGPAVGLVLLLMDTMPALLNGARFSLADHPGNYIHYTALYGLGIGLAASLHVRPADEGTSQDPATSIAQDHSTFRKLAPITAVAAGLGFAGIYTVSALGSGHLAPAAGGHPSTGHPMEHLPPAVRALAYALSLGAAGVTVGLATALSRTAWWPHTLARAYLTLKHRLPYDLAAFLTDAHERRLVLRQVGAVYQFRHQDLQHHLAAQPNPPRQAHCQTGETRQPGEPSGARRN
ncbi:NACHT domain-containing protein [Streptomyces phaeochromogenes]|uniref:NACHT domain-containing protein n=1 Tax=Streptomyces phaeochromogenes TaxID=1923 RepID=UPI0033C255A4